MTPGIVGISILAQLVIRLAAGILYELSLITMARKWGTKKQRTSCHPSIFNLDRSLFPAPEP